MKLRNKKTGEIIDLNKGSITGHGTTIQLQAIDRYNKPIWNYNSLAELNEVWEDYEEANGWWYIDENYEAHTTNSTLRDERKDREIGNCFSCKEDAEKAVQKLKAWKRLKDADFSITGWDNSIGDDYYKPAQIVIRLNNNPDDFDEYEDIGPFKNDLDLLFGGKE